MPAVLGQLDVRRENAELRRYAILLRRAIDQNGGFQGGESLALVMIEAEISGAQTRDLEGVWHNNLVRGLGWGFTL